MHPYPVSKQTPVYNAVSVYYTYYSYYYERTMQGCCKYYTDSYIYTYTIYHQGLALDRGTGLGVCSVLIILMVLEFFAALAAAVNCCRTCCPGSCCCPGNCCAEGEMFIFKFVVVHDVMVSLTMVISCMI